MKRLAPLLIITALLFCCTEKKPADRMTDEQLRSYADELAHTNIITDGHVDLPYRLRMKNFRPEREYMSIPVSTTEGDFDYERAKKGGLSAPFMSIYIPSSYQQQPDFGKALADSLINMIRTIAEQIPDKFALANSATEVEANFKAGKISLPMHGKWRTHWQRSGQHKIFLWPGHPLHHIDTWQRQSNLRFIIRHHTHLERPEPVWRTSSERDEQDGHHGGYFARVGQYIF